MTVSSMAIAAPASFSGPAGAAASEPANTAADLAVGETVILLTSPLLSY